jgi:hypothetical protein
MGLTGREYLEEGEKKRNRGKKRKITKASRVEEAIIPNSEQPVLSWSWIVERFTKAAVGAQLTNIAGKFLFQL